MWRALEPELYPKGRNIRLRWGQPCGWSAAASSTRYFSAHFFATHTGFWFGIAQPIGGHIGGGEAVHAASNFFFQAVVPAWLVHPGQHARDCAESTSSSSVMAQSASVAHAVSSGGMARGGAAEDDETEAAAATADGAGSGDAGAGTLLSQARRPTRPAATTLATFFRCITRAYTYPGGSMGTKPPESASKVS